MLIGLLGPITIAPHAVVRPVTPNQKAVLARLALTTREPVMVDDLVEWVWGDDDCPSNQHGALQVTVSRLRRSLVDNVSLETRDRSYELHVEREEVDLFRFQHRLKLIGSNDGVEALEELRSSLSLWRGPAFADIRPTPAVLAERARLAELHLSTLEHYHRRVIETGDVADLLPELAHLVSKYPFRENLVAQLMTCLDMVGRRPEALAEYRRTHARFRQMLGVEPGTALQTLHLQILRRRTDVQAATDDRRGAEPELIHEHEFDPGGPDPARPVITVVAGPPGSGSSTVAQRLARVAGAKAGLAHAFVDLVTTPCEGTELPPIAARVLSGQDLHNPSARPVLVIDGVTQAAQVVAYSMLDVGQIVVASSRILSGLDSARIRRIQQPSERPAMEIFRLMLAERDRNCPVDILRQIVRLCDANLLALKIVATNLAMGVYQDPKEAVDTLDVAPDVRVVELNSGEQSTLTSFWRAISACSELERQSLATLVEADVETVSLREAERIVHAGVGRLAQAGIRGLVQANLATLFVDEGESRLRLSPLCAGAVRALTEDAAP